MSGDEAQAGCAGPPDTLSATVNLPFAGLERAASVLRGQLRSARDDEQARPGAPVRVVDWDTLTVDGPVVAVGPDGRSWFTYTGQVSTRALRPLD